MVWGWGYLFGTKRTKLNTVEEASNILKYVHENAEKYNEITLSDQQVVFTNAKLSELRETLTQKGQCA